MSYIETWDKPVYAIGIAILREFIELSG